jgi:beta-glucanase (GH16 family)
MRKLLIATAVVALSAAASLSACGGDDDGRSRALQTATVYPVSDTTISQVQQDGDLGKATTLSSCPARCESNPSGRRDAQLQFAVDQLPPDATDVKAIFKIYSWQDAAARVAVQTSGGGTEVRESVAKGFNDFTVPVRADGTYTITLSQESLESRVYWASMENPLTELRPQLVIAYRSATKGWKLVWADEFDGTTLDGAKWNLRNGEARDVDLGCNVDSPKNTFVGGGNLTLRALREPVACGSQTRQFSQSYLDTMGKASWTYGRFEVRAKSPTTATGSTGLWPAFWLRPDDGGNGEIDVTELPGGAGWYDKATASIFWDYTPVKQDVRIPLNGDGWHTYATEWAAGALRWYIDGRLVWTRDPTTTPWFDQAFHKPYNLRLNMQVGGWLGTPDAATVFPADFLVDYVRVYQR